MMISSAFGVVFSFRPVGGWSGAATVVELVRASTFISVKGGVELLSGNLLLLYDSREGKL
jgi:hypothetical protein